MVMLVSAETTREVYIDMEDTRGNDADKDLVVPGILQLEGFDLQVDTLLAQNGSQNLVYLHIRTVSQCPALFCFDVFAFFIVEASL